ncbi:trimethyllysine dioxygenase [Hyaloscypha hepaticicola]|uniref:Trimethyllysine dioxygenase n=1 Tax=Hyaloscypha hepaticicola TaxID=2082293 RepID=A0A2J6Q1V3_9HELO|nr:trimethyllysine dioxygenase [Hyaloscypha hepaticicola]
MQRALDTFSIPTDILPEEVTTLKEGLQIKWANDGHVSLYPWDWIVRHRKQPGILLSQKEKDVQEEPYTYWGSDIESNPPSVHYDEVMADDTGVGTWTAKIRKYGFCYVDECPVSPAKTQELLERIAFIRLTHYGGFYDFTADLTMKDTAYTTLALSAHTDTTYFTDPAGLQMFHLLSHTDGEGGASLLVDGFKAARTLQQESVRDYNILSSTPIPWHASGNEGITITPAKKFPVINFEDFQEGRYAVPMQIRWNNDDRGVVELREDRGMGAEKWYGAARKWNEILKRPEMEYWAQLRPGRPLIFDNWRVLHGRSAFTGKRRICGGYINHDDYISRWRNTNFTRDEVLKQIL